MFSRCGLSRYFSVPTNRTRNKQRSFPSTWTITWYLKKIEAPTGRAVLNYTQWFNLVAFKNHIPKGEVHELGDWSHTLPIHCGRYVRIVTKNIQLLLSKNEWTYLMEIASACINRQVIWFSRLQDDLVTWWNKCLQERALSTPPDANGIDFDSLYDELNHRASLFNKNNPDPD